MKLKAFVISGLLIIFSIIQIWASNLHLDDQINSINLIKLASVETLKEDINQTLGDSYFLEKTQLHTRLGGTIGYSEEILFVIDSAIYYYLDNMKRVITPAQMFDLSSEMYKSRTLLKKAIFNTAEPDSTHWTNWNCYWYYYHYYGHYGYYWY